MILKKPYAFLIKNFKIIHIILSIIIIVIISLFGNVTGFFSGYIRGTITGTIGLASTYINSMLYVLLLIVIAFSLAMFLLMRKKEKPTLFYITLFGYYLIVLILVIIAAGVLKSVESASLTQQSSRAYRDIYLILSAPQYYFLIISIIRGIGFDVKKFNFNKDLEELEIKSEDNEEFEFVLGTDSYKYKRKIRRTFRELKYYVLENKLIFSAIATVVTIVLAAFLIVNFNFLNRVYKVGSSGTIGNFNYTLVNAYETKYDYNGNLVSKGKKYVILDMIITNRATIPQTLDNISFYLKAGSTSVYNMPSLRNYFIDFGKSYINDNISPGNTGKYIFVFEVDENVKYKKYYLNVLKNIEYKDGVAIYNYSKFKIAPNVIDKVAEKEAKKLNDAIYFGNNIFGDSNIVFKTAEIKNSYEYRYELCENDVCTQYYDVVAPNNSAEDSMLILNYKLNIKQDIGLRETMQTDKSFFDKFLKIEYNYNGKKIVKNLNAKTYKNLNNLVFIEIPKNAIRSDLNNLLISTRNNHYYINLKNI